MDNTDNTHGLIEPIDTKNKAFIRAFGSSMNNIIHGEGTHGKHFSMENCTIYSNLIAGNISLKNSTEEHTSCETGLDRLLETF